MGPRIPVALILLAACGPSESPAPAVRVVGGRGESDGRFVRPRGLARAPDGAIYVVDKTGRIQRFDAGGAFVRVWSPPDVTNGQAIDLTVGPDGLLYVADTHQSRILVYTPDGSLVRQWGRYGREPGEFIYPTGLAFSKAEIFVAEYGGNDRIQVFTLEGKFLRGWGSYGDDPDQFKRPQDLAIGADGRVYVVDAADHGVHVFESDGRRVTRWGKPGRDPGQLSYPYGIGIMACGDVILCEYGNHRLQRFRPDGTFVAIYGGVGAEPGQLNTPWDIEVVGDSVVIIADTQNHRVQYWTLDGGLDARNVR